MSVLQNIAAALRLPQVELAETQGFVVAIVAIALVWIVFDRCGQ